MVSGESEREREKERERGGERDLFKIYQENSIGFRTCVKILWITSSVLKRENRLVKTLIRSKIRDGKRRYKYESVVLQVR